MSSELDDRLITSSLPTDAQFRVIFGVAALLVVALVVTAPYARQTTQGTEIFVAGYAAAIFVIEVTTAAILLVSYAVFGVRLHINGWLPVYIVLEVFAFGGIGMLLTPIAKEAESAVAAANAFLFPMMFLSGTFFPVEMMPELLQSFARVLPLYYVNEGLRASMIFDDGATALRFAAVTAGVAAAVFVAGAAVTRWNREA